MTDIYRDINEFRVGYLHKTNTVKQKNALLAAYDNILNRRENLSATECTKAV